MTHRFLALLFCSFLSVPLLEGSVAFVYEDEQAAIEGKFELGSQTQEGVVVSIEVAMKAGGNPFVGFPGQPVQSSSVTRLDQNLGVALLSLGDILKNEAVQISHAKSGQLYNRVFGNGSHPASENMSYGNQNSTQPYNIYLNGVVIGDKAEIILPMKKDKTSDFTLEVERLGDPVWKLKLNLTSEPELSFWKKGKKKSLNEIPRPNFEYAYQSFFKKFGAGKKLKTSVEAHFIKQDKYNWTISIESKDEPTWTRTVSIEFKPL